MEKYNLESFLAESFDIVCPNGPITAKKLQHPTKEFVIEVYEYFRSTIKECLNRITGDSNEAVDPISESELIFELSHFVNKYFIYIISDVTNCSISLIDFYAPTAKRTKVRFKLLLGFMRFFQKHEDLLREAVMSRKIQAMKMSSLKEEKEQGKIDIANQAENIARSDDEIHKLKIQVKEAEDCLEGFQKLKDDREQQYKKLQQELNVALGTYESKEALIKNLKMNIASFNDQIVTKDSYSSLSDLKKNLSKKCDELEVDSVHIADTLSQKVLDIDNFKIVHKQIEDLFSLGKELLSPKEVFSEIKSEPKQLEDKDNAKIKEIGFKNESILKIKISNKEKKANFQSEMLKNNNLIKQITEKIAQVINEQSEENELQNKFWEKEAILKQVRSSILTKLEQEKDEVNSLKNVYTSMYSKRITTENTITTNFNKTLENILEIISEDE